MENNKTEREIRHERQQQEIKQFKEKLINSINDYHFSYKQAEMLFQYAWERGHSCGYHEVELYFEEIVDWADEFIKNS